MARWPRKSKVPLEQTTTMNPDGRTMTVKWSKPKPTGELTNMTQPLMPDLDVTALLTPMKDLNLGPKIGDTMDKAKLDSVLPSFDKITSEGQATKAREMQEGSICIFIKTKRLTTRRSVDQDDVTVAEAGANVIDTEIDQDSVTVAKELLKSKELKAIGAYDHMTRRWFRQRSVPSPLLKSSAYCFATAALPEMYEYLEQRAEERVALVEKLIEQLPNLKAQAEKDLGPLFDPTEYPGSDQAARDLFDFTWQVVEIISPNRKMRSVSQTIFEKEKAKAEQTWVTAGKQIEAALAEGMAKLVEHLAKQLGDGKDKPKRLRQESIANVLTFLDTFQQRNITGSADLAKLVDEAKNLVLGVDVKDLRKDDAFRQRIVEGVASVNAKLSKMIEDKPSRAISLDDEEV